MKSTYFFAVLTLSFAGQLFGAASSSIEQSHLTILAVGGQNTLGSEEDYVSLLFQVPTDHIIRAQLP